MMAGAGLTNWQLVAAAIGLALLLNLVGAIEARSLDCLPTCLGGLPKLEDKDWKHIWAELTEKYVKPDEVFSKVCELNQIFDTHRVPEEALDIKDMVDEQIRAPEMEKLPCNDENIIALGINTFSKYARFESLQGHMQRSRNIFISGCSEKIADEVYKNVTNLSTGHRVDGKELAAEVETAIEGQPIDYMFGHGLVRYGPRALGELLIKQNHDKVIKALRSFLHKKQRGPLSKVYREHVVDACQAWMSATARMHQLYDYLERWHKNKSEMLEHLDRADLCEYIFAHKERIEAELGVKAETVVAEESDD